MDISKILMQNKDRILHPWITQLRSNVSPAYSAQPVEELSQTVSAAVDANFSAVVDQNFQKIDTVIEWIGQMRSKAGFSLSELQKAFEIYRTVLMPILFRELPPMNSCRPWSASTGL